MRKKQNITEDSMTSKELAQLIGVSQSTISRALSGSPRISEKRRQEILEMVEKYNFELNINAKNLRTRTSTFIGIVMPDYFRSLIDDDFRALQFNYLYEELSKSGYDLIMINNDEISDNAGALEGVVRKRQLCGLILSRRFENDSVIEYLKGLSIPLVAMTRCNEKMQFIPSVTSDSYGMGYLIGKHFAKGNYRHAAFIRIKNHKSGELTAKGFEDALKEGNVIFTENDTFFTGFDFQSGYNTVKENLDKIRQYDAVFAQNDTMALGVISALRDNGISVPGDIAVAGNNDIPSAQWFSPHLTTVRTFIEIQARIACERIVSLIRNGTDPYDEKHYIVKPELIVRESCP